MLARLDVLAWLTVLGLCSGASAQQAPAPSTPASAPAAPDNRAVATYKGGEITVAELREALASLPPEARAKYEGKEGRKALLEEAIEFELLAAEARRRGYDTDERVLQVVRKAATQTLVQERITDTIDGSTISDADVAAYYKEHEGEFNVPDRRRASRILLKTQEEAAALLKELKGKDLRAFRDAAQHKSLDDQNKLRGGDLLYFDQYGNTESGKAGPAEALAQAAFAISNIGELAPKPIKTEDGYNVLILTGKRPGKHDPLEVVEPLIRARLVQEKRQEALDALVAKLKAELKPEVFPKRITLVEFNPDAPMVPKSKKLPANFPERPAAEQAAE